MKQVIRRLFSVWATTSQAITRDLDKPYCTNCGAWAILEPSVPYTEERKEEILRAYQERPSMRGIERIFGVARQTLTRWLKEKGAGLPDLSDTLDQAKE